MLKKGVVLSLNDRKKFAAFIMLLMQIDKRINADAHKRRKAAALRKRMRDSQDNEGSLLYFITYTINLPSTALSLMRFIKYLIRDTAYDRHRGFTALLRYV